MIIFVTFFGIFNEEKNVVSEIELNFKNPDLRFMVRMFLSKFEKKNPFHPRERVLSLKVSLGQQSPNMCTLKKVLVSFFFQFKRLKFPKQSSFLRRWFFNLTYVFRFSALLGLAKFVMVILQLRKEQQHG